MTVKELREELSRFDDDTRVAICDDFNEDIDIKQIEFAAERNSVIIFMED